MPTGMDMHLHSVSIGIKSSCAGALSKDGSMHTAITVGMEKHGIFLRWLVIHGKHRMIGMSCITNQR